MNVALIGPAGAGKHSHAACLEVRYGLRPVSIPEIIRHYLRTPSALGQAARKHVQQGTPVSDELVRSMVESWCSHLPGKTGALFDGFPTTVAQAEMLDTSLARIGRSLDAVVFFAVGDDEIVRRRGARIVCEQCHTTYHAELKPPSHDGVCDLCGAELSPRAQLDAATIRAELSGFSAAVTSVLAHYQHRGVLHTLSGEGSMAEVNARLIQTLDRVREPALAAAAG